MQSYAEYAFRRGFLVTSLPEDVLRARLDVEEFANLQMWNQTYFGPDLKLWHDPFLKLARRDSPQFSVAIMGLAINPYDGTHGNDDLAEALFVRLQHSRKAFRDYVDELTGSFLILRREGADVYLQQDAAATKTVYYHTDRDGRISAAVHARIVARLHDLKPDPLAAATWEAESYRKDPSRYLPGMVTPFAGLNPLSANGELYFTQREPRRFFPREALQGRAYGEDLVEEIAGVFRRQAQMIGALGRPMHLAATGGRDSRVSFSAFQGQPTFRTFSFHYPSRRHLSRDVEVACELSKISGTEIDIFDLEFKSAEKTAFSKAFNAHSPGGIWLDAAFSYVRNFSDDAIHIRSTVSEIGRVFYVQRWAKQISGANFASTYTFTPFNKTPWVVETLNDFFRVSEFTREKIFNYDPYDIFYWEHRNSKWQNILCVEAEMACDVFIPFNNRRLLKSFMSVPYEDRKSARLHLAVIDLLCPDFSQVELV